jgi:hypothetical protein
VAAATGGFGRSAVQRRQPLNLTGTPDASEINPLFSPDSKTVAVGLKKKQPTGRGRPSHGVMMGNGSWRTGRMPIARSVVLVTSNEKGGHDNVALMDVASG